MGEVNTKFKVCVNAAGKMAPIVLHSPIFTEAELAEPYYVIKVPGSTTGGGEGLGYVVLSCKGLKDENGVSPSEQVTRWYYETIVQDGFILRQCGEQGKMLISIFEQSQS